MAKATKNKEAPVTIRKVLVDSKKDAAAIVARIEAFRAGLNPTKTGEILLSALQADAQAIINRISEVKHG